MISTSEAILIIAICAVITFLERAIPFLIFKNGKVPQVIDYLGEVIPMAIMMTLVFYTLKDYILPSFTGEERTLWPRLIACVVTVAIHLWRKNTFLSILTGTLTCMILIHFVF